MDESGFPTREGRAARQALERTLLVVSESLHTDRGFHTALVRPWRESPFAAHRAAAGRLDMDVAIETLLGAAIRGSVLVPERSATRWFEGCPEAVERLIEREAVQRLTDGRRTWLTS